MIEQFTEVWGQWGRAWPLLLERWAAADGWLLIRWMAQNLSLSALIAAIDLGAGAALLSLGERWTGTRLSARLFTLNALAAGIGVAGLLTFALAWAGHLSVFGAMLACAAMSLPGWLACHRRLRLGLTPVVPGSKLALAVALILLPAALLHLADLFQPIQEGDSTMYHMVAARHYLDHGSLAYHEGIRFNAQPHLSVLLYLRHWVALGDDMLVKLFNLELTLLLLLALAAGARLFRIRHGLTLAIVFSLISPVFAWMTKTEYADLMLTAFVATATVTMAWAIERRSMALGVVASVAVGVAGAVKFQGLVMGGLSSAVLLIFLYTRRVRVLPVACALLASTVLFGGGWWIRSWGATGTPVYPFLSSSVDLRRLMEVNASYGFGRSPQDFAMLPVRAMGHYAHRFADPYILGPVLALWIVGLLLRPGLRHQGRAFVFSGLMLFAWFWFRSGQVMRYLACAMPALALSFGDSMARLNAHLPAALVLMLAPLATATWMLPSRTLATAFPPPVRWTDKETVLAESLSHYRAARFLNAQAPKDARVYVWFCEDSRFYLQRANDGDWFGPRSYFWLSTGAREPRELTRRLRAAGYGFLLLDRRRAAERLEMFDLDFAQTEFMKTWGSPESADRLYDDGRYAVYRLKE